MGQWQPLGLRRKDFCRWKSLSLGALRAARFVRFQWHQTVQLVLCLKSQAAVPDGAICTIVPT